MSSIHTFITIPVCGEPFIEAEINKNSSKEILTHLHIATESDDVCVIRVPVVIHPMFVKEKRRWAIADNLIRAKQGVKIWAVSDFMDYSTNAATVLTDPRSRFGGCPHLCGTIVLQVTPAAMAKFCPDADVLRTVELADDWNDDDESVAKFEAEAKSKGYDLSVLDHSGQVFIKSC